MALPNNPTLEEIVNETERLNNLIVDRGGAKTITPKTNNQVLAKGNYKGDITIKGDANLKPENILSGKSIFGIAGTVPGTKLHVSTYTINGTKLTINPSANNAAKARHRVSVNFGFTPTYVFAIVGRFTLNCYYTTNKDTYIFDTPTLSNHSDFYFTSKYITVSIGEVTSSGFYLELFCQKFFSAYEMGVTFNNNIQIIAVR